jgi:hypothetical protein
MADYDNASGIADYIESHEVEGLRKVMRLRREGFSRKESLSQFIVLGRYWLDTCGNLGLITEARGRGPQYADAMWLVRGLPGVVRIADVSAFLRSVSITWTPTGLPDESERCPECGYGWTIDNVEDAVERRAIDGDHYERFHSACLDVRGTRRALTRFRSIADAGDLRGAPILTIPNEYWPPTYRESKEPWVLIRTAYGDIKLGERKRVLSIDWKDVVERTTPAKEDPGERYEAKRSHADAWDGKMLFPNEDVTRWETGIHAYGNEKAAEYLRLIVERMRATGAPPAPLAEVKRG